MIIEDNISPFVSELPSEYADRLGILYTKQVTALHKKENGQYFTPTPIAHFMASFCTNLKNHIQILDPGCGTAVLSCSLIEHLVRNNNSLERIELIVYETDPALISYSERVMLFTKEYLKKRNIEFHYIIKVCDFVLDNSLILKNNNQSIEEFDVIISNPPYFKLSKGDPRAQSSQELVSGQPNIYSLFMGVASKLLKENGELIFITPRSFASGNYFKAFRKFFFNTVQIERIHLFDSRKDTFNRDSVLQETVIIKAIKAEINPMHKVMISSSKGFEDIDNLSVRYFYSNELINLKSIEKILHLPTNDKEETVFRLVSQWTNKLIDYDIQISTGPVVSFRASKHIYIEYKNGSVYLAPLFWLHNVTKMGLTWPKEYKDKGQYISIEAESRPLLISNKNCVLLRRFSTKDDKSRLIATPYYAEYSKSNLIGIENKLNYIYKLRGEFNKNEVLGLSALLNSDLFDTYFQIFNGNVNVSATELREMNFPSWEFILHLGNELIHSNDLSMENVNNLVNNLFELEVFSI